MAVRVDKQMGQATRDDDCRVSEMLTTQQTGTTERQNQCGPHVAVRHGTGFVDSGPAPGCHVSRWHASQCSVVKAWSLPFPGWLRQVHGDSSPKQQFCGTSGSCCAPRGSVAQS